MRRSAVLIACLILFSMTSTLWAQPRANGFSFTVINRAVLVGIDVVDQELLLDQSQRPRIEALAKEVQEELQLLLNTMDPIKAQQALPPKYLKQLDEILTTDQIERLDQILLRVAELEAYTDPRVVKRLTLSNTQQAQITTINQQFAAKLMKRPPGETSQEHELRRKEALLTRGDKLVAVLTPEQQAEFFRMKGKDFDVSLIRQGLLGRFSAPQRFSFPTSGVSFSDASITLASNAMVQKDLSASAEQIDKIRSLVEEARNQIMAAEDQQRLPATASPEERRKLMEERIAKRADVMRAAKKQVQASLTEILDENQQKRMEQIELQVLRVKAFNAPKVVASLKYTKEQQDQLDAVFKELDEELRQSLRRTIEQRPAIQGNREALEENVKAGMQKADQLNEAAKKKIEALLTAEQRDQFAALKGQDFDLAAYGEAERSRLRPRN